MIIGILTYYGVHNHGAVLQANALKTILSNIGYECGFLAFERSYSNITSEQTSKYKIGLYSIPFYAKYLLEKGPGNIYYNLKKRKTLSTFRMKNLPMIGSYEDFTGDLIIIGSDEVFSLEIGVNPILYGNNLKAKHVISYAASFGPTTYEEIIRQGRTDMIASGIRQMDAVSVRDRNSAEVVEKVADIQAELVCDPVILYGYREEMNSFSPPIKNYILVYSYDKNLNDEKEYRYIVEYAEKRSLKIVSVGYYHRWCKNIDATPFELLSWVKSANLVVTDTFHGAVMSIICNTPAVVKLRNNQNKLSFLLEEYGLSRRAISSFEELELVAAMPVDFAEVNKRIAERRNYSMEYLSGALAKCR